MKDFEKWITNGITITGDASKGYCVFTIPTQHFNVKSLDELTPARFEMAQTELAERDLIESELFKSMFE
jgi:hypothetical protein